MAKKRGKKAPVPAYMTRGPLGGLISLVLWLVGILVSLAVGFAMVDGTLSVLYIPSIVTEVAGWIVVILVLVGVVLKIIDKIKG